MDTAAFRRAALLPKPRTRTPFIPALPEHALATLLGALAPLERRALAEIAETADLVEVEGAPPHLLVPASPQLLDALAVFAADLEDRENDLEDESQDIDDDSPAELEPSLGATAAVNQSSWGKEGHSYAYGGPNMPDSKLDAELDPSECEREPTAPPAGARKSTEAFAQARRARRGAPAGAPLPAEAAPVRHRGRLVALCEVLRTRVLLGPTFRREG